MVSQTFTKALVTGVADQPVYLGEIMQSAAENKSVLGQKTGGRSNPAAIGARDRGLAQEEHRRHWAGKIHIYPSNSQRAPGWLSGSFSPGSSLSRVTASFSKMRQGPKCMFRQGQRSPNARGDLPLPDEPFIPKLFYFHLLQTASF